MSAKQTQLMQNMGDINFNSAGGTPINPYQNKNQSMPNTVFHSNTNSPVNNKSMQQQIMKGQYIAGAGPGALGSKGNSRSNATSMQGSPIKH